MSASRRGEPTRRVYSAKMHMTASSARIFVAATGPNPPTAYTVPSGPSSPDGPGYARRHAEGRQVGELCRDDQQHRYPRQ